MAGHCHFFSRVFEQIPQSMSRSFAGSYKHYLPANLAFFDGVCACGNRACQ